MKSADRHLKDIWWLFMLRGIALILFGLVAVLWPGWTLVALATAFAVMLLVSGVADIIAAIRGLAHRSLWFLQMLLGLAELGVGVYLIKNQYVLATFIAIVGLSLIVIGILEIIGAFEPGEDAGRRFLAVIVGVLSVIAGFIVLRYPVSSGLTFVWVLGLWGLIAGAVQVAMCLSMRSHLDEIEDVATGARN
jgi:uncharacterized membrane protein HdeD (DUF308 family)